MRSRTAGVMTTLMRNGRDRRSGQPAKCHARKERERLFGTRSADYIRASSHNGCIQRPNTWLHPNASLKCPIFPLHRGRRPYMALSARSDSSPERSLLSNSGHWSALALIGSAANDAVDGAHSAASKCHRVVASKRNHIEGSRPWARLA